MEFNLRQQQSIDALIAFLPSHPEPEKTLLVENYTSDLLGTLDYPDTWNTRYHAKVEASTVPHVTKKYTTIIIRLPKSHSLFDYILRVLTSYTEEGCSIIVYGMNDEGIKGAQKKMADFYDNCDVLGYKNKCRVLQSHTKKDDSSKKVDLLGFAQESTLSLFGKNIPMIFFPGMFAQNTLDAATAFLLEHLPSFPEDATILDYACGSGIIAKGAHMYAPNASIDLLDNDILSLEAAHMNCESFGRDYYLAENLNDTKKYDIIISNPPMHTEKYEHTSIIDNLITKAPEHLNVNGSLIIVVQSRLALDNLFSKHYSSHTKIAYNTRFTIWRGTI